MSSSLISCGWNGFGQLGIGNVEFQDSFCSLSLTGVDVVQVFCGGHHYAGFSAVLSSDGRVFVWGDNSFGQLGFDSKKKPCLAPQALVLQEKAVSVACGSQHMVVVLASGRVAAFGDDSFGQLPKSIDPSMFVTAAACGDAHTLLLLKNGKILGFGSDKLGQIGGCALIQGEVVKVACGQSHSLVLLRNGSVFAFGSNTHAQLGVPGADFVVKEPLRVPLPNVVVALSAGHFHSIVLDAEGCVFGFGSNEHNQLGMQDILMCSGPIRVPVASGKVVSVVAGGLHSLLLLGNGSVVTLGCQSEGQGKYKGPAKAAAAAETHNLFIL